MEAALRIVVPRIVGDLSFQIYRHQCKDDLLERLSERLCGYSKWLPEDWCIVVVVDRDNDDCRNLRARITQIARDAHLPVRERDSDQPFSVVIRLAIEELEAWFFGDCGAVRSAYPRVPEGIPRQASFRDPDAIRGGTWEAFERVLQKVGYFKSGLRKIEAARVIADRMRPEVNRSNSFRALRDVLREMAT